MKEISPMPTLADAIKLAVEKHGQTLDKSGREPYILHPLRVMLAQEGEAARMAAVLHDAVEDTDLTFADLERAGYPAEVLDALRLLTHDPAVPYEEYVERLAGNSLARAVKLADLEDNMNLRRMAVLREKDHARLDRYLRAWRRLKGL
jgi:(p)ppGpp synthase/HD superfamily hydrolase